MATETVTGRSLGEGEIIFFGVNLDSVRSSLMERWLMCRNRYATMHGLLANQYNRQVARITVSNSRQIGKNLVRNFVNLERLGDNSFLITEFSETRRPDTIEKLTSVIFGPYYDTPEGQIILLSDGSLWNSAQHHMVDDLNTVIQVAQAHIEPMVAGAERTTDLLMKSVQNPYLNPAHVQQAVMLHQA